MGHFVFRTKDGLIFGPYSTYESALYWSKQSMFEIDDIYGLNTLRPDQLKGPKA